jgi:hypothetical protein
MKPIRQAELDFLVNLTDSKFSSKSEIIDTEISMKANELAEKQKTKFARLLGIEALLKKVVQASKKYQDFKTSKGLVEHKLERECSDASYQLTMKLNQMKKARKWDTSFDTFDSKDDDASYFTNKLDEVCYDEAKKSVQKQHKIYNSLKALRDNCKLIIHTGADINNTVQVLQIEMGRADIKLPIPKQLLQLSVK